MERCEVCGEPLSRCQCSMQVCASCGREYKELAYGALCRSILRQQPACCYECNRALGQVSGQEVSSGS